MAQLWSIPAFLVVFPSFCLVSRLNLLSVPGLLPVPTTAMQLLAVVYKEY